MLTPEQALPFLQHQDRAVRDHAVRYLVGTIDCGPATADDLWRCIDRYGMEQSAACLRNLSHLPQTQYSYKRLTEALSRVTNNWERHDLETAFIGLSWDVLDQNRDEVLASETVPAFMRNHHARRLKLDTMSFDDLWVRLSHFAASASEETDEDDDLGDDPIDPHEGLGDDDLEDQRLVETLVRRFPQAACARAFDGVRAGPTAEARDRMQQYCVDILGRAEDRGAVPLLLERLSSADDEMLTSPIASAIARLGDPDLVARLVALYRDETNSVEWHTIIGTLGSINIPETETALVQLLRSERDFDLDRALARCLIKLCASPAALEEVRSFIVRSLQHQRWERLAEQILPAATMVGFESPDLKTWRHVFDDRNISATLEAEWAKRYSAAAAPPLEVASNAIPLTTRGASSIQPAVTIHRSAPKVGRNDACPCGSGMKYKKCCMKSEA